MLPFHDIVDLGAMKIKAYFAFLKVSLLEPHHQIVWCVIQDFHWGGLTALQRCTWCILQPKPTGRLLIYKSGFTRRYIGVIFTENVASMGIYATLGKANNTSLFNKYPSKCFVYLHITKKSWS